MIDRKSMCPFVIILIATCTCLATPHILAGERQVAVTTIPIIVSEAATDVERTAAGELAKGLEALYPTTRFPVTATVASPAARILLGTPETAPDLAARIESKRLAGPESYVVTTAEIEGQTSGLIVGADPAGVVYGVYGLLRKLGCGYYLNSDVLPPPKTEPFSFTEWQACDRPLVPTRLVFNWHNFLSGCSTWNVEHWQQWIVQSQKMGYNAVMVHAYGNNPMAGFQFRGLQKPVGYLSSTRVGRDWSTNHVNDVRRLFGGKLFDSPVFGSVAAIDGTDAQRTAAAEQLMSEAFACAERRGVDVYFAVDIDTTSANPQQLIRALPEDARFTIDVPAMQWMGQQAGEAWLVNPDTEAGYGFYRAQVARLLEVYPQIDCLVVWHRKSNTPWMSFSLESMPEKWREQYKSEIERTPGAADLWHSLHMFAQAKVVRAFQRALAELKRTDVRVAFGSWDFDFLPAADRFLPREVTFIPLDWMVLRDQSIFDTPEQRASVAEVAAHRGVIPVAWAHHDDGNYVGRPYTPYSDFHDRLAEMKCDTAGYGIIHWTTKPLDIYFKSLSDQVWASSKNQSLNETCRQMATHLVGPEQAEPFADYLQAWVTTMPKIGRETSDFFIDHELKDLVSEEAAQRHRLDLLNKVDRERLSPNGREWVDYFTGLENYILDIYRTEDMFNRAKKQYLAGDLSAARSTMAACRPEEVIQRFAEFSRRGGLTRGEEGLVVTMNTRWLPHYVRFRQMIGADVVRFNYAPTSHDPLAQSRGIFTFHFDAQGDVWQSLGAEETGGEEFTRPAVGSAKRAAGGNEVYDEICRNGIESAEPITLALQPILPSGSRSGFEPATLPAGAYELTLLFLDPQTKGTGERVFDLRVALPQQRRFQHYRIPPVRASYLRLQCRGNDKNSWNSICELRCAALDRTGSIKSSGQVKGYAAKSAADGKLATRWAVEGREHWIQFALDRDRPVDELEILWFEGGARQYDFDILVSDDGRQWREVTCEQMAGPSELLTRDRVDIFQRAGGANRVAALSYPVQLTEPSGIELTLTPVKGKALICGAVLKPVDRPAAPLQ